jgi:hypothetical protein
MHRQLYFLAKSNQSFDNLELKSKVSVIHNFFQVHIKVQ